MHTHRKSSMDKDTDLTKSHIETAANDLLKDGKKLANALYQDTLNKVSETQDGIEKYSDELLSKVQQNPLASVLIAGGIGFLISMFMKK